MNVHTKSLITACQQLSLKYEMIGDSGVFIRVWLHDNPYYFISNKMPFNSGITEAICIDKGHTYTLLKDIITQPESFLYIDPHPHKDYLKPFAQHKDYLSIAIDIESHLSYPLIIKPSSKSTGINVFLCHKQTDLLKAINAIFDHNNADYDHALLAQSYIAIAKEYRVTVFQRQIMLMYLKDNSNATYIGNQSPLHWQGAKAVIENSQQLNQRIQAFIDPIFDIFPLVYAGLDIAIDHDDNIWLIEINTFPAYGILVEHQGQTPLTNLYSKMLKEFKPQ